MKKNLIVTGGIFHPFLETSNSLSNILSEMDYVSEITTDVEKGFSNLNNYDLLTMNFLRWRMLNHEKYIPYIDEWQFSLSNKSKNLLEDFIKKGGKFYASVPASWPEKICWALSKEYQNQPGGHLRIFNQKDLVTEIEGVGFNILSTEKFHSIHSAYWWLRCLFWKTQDSNFLVKIYKKMLERHILKKPFILDRVDKLLNPLMGKSFSMYFEK